MRIPFLALILVTSAPLHSPPVPRPVALGEIGFATAVALQGDELFIGHPGISMGWQFNPSTPGAVHLFRRTEGGAWDQTGVIAPADAEIADGYGKSLAVRGDLMAVGAQDKGAGVVYLYERAAGGWREVARLAPAGGATGDRFGATLAFSDGVLLVGSPGYAEGRGAVDAFRRSASGTWSLSGRLGTGIAAGAYFGTSLSVSGDRVAIGAPGAADVGGRTTDGVRGTVALYRRTSDGWRPRGILEPPADVDLAGFGFSVLFDGTALFASAPHTSTNTGLVLEFPAEAEGWRPPTMIAPARPSTQTGFGAALAMSNGTLLVGAPIRGGRAGAVHVFRRMGGGGGGWSEQQILTEENAPSATYFGRGLSASDGRVAVSGPMADFWEGTGWVYEPGASGWERRSTVIPPATPLPAIAGESRCDADAVAGFPCAQVDLLAFLPLSGLGASRGVMLNDLWGWTDPETNREYALVGRVDGTAFVDVTDPERPAFLGDLPMHAGGRPNRWRDMKTYRNHVFIVADNGGVQGMQVFDLTRLRNVANAPVTFTADAHYDRFAESHNIIINEETGFAYAVGSGGGGESCGGGLHMIDIREPKRPLFAGCHADPKVGRQGTGGVHDAQCVIYRGPDARYRGRELCFNSAETALAIVDVTDKSATRTVAVAAYPSTSYAHQGWLTEDQGAFFMGDEGDELDGTVSRTRTIGWDVRDLEDPVLLTEFLGSTAAVDHNLYIKGRYMYQSNYAAGLRVIDIADPANPRETGWFDSVPGSDAPGWAGSWSNYPFFPSGTIVFTSRKEGLFVVRHRPRELVP